MKHRGWGAWKLFRESFLVVFATGLIALAGGIALERIEAMLLTIIPLLVLLPALNDAIGGIGTITGSRFTSILYLYGEETGLLQREEITSLFKNVAVTSTVTAAYLGVLASGIAYVKGFSLTLAVAGKVLFIALACTAILFLVVFGLAVGGGLYVYRNGGDPDNYLIPVTTVTADIGNMLLFSLLVWLLF
jgi:cation transporter-like permease